jgi:hypothetical protein
VELTAIVGCEVWFMVLILRISDLDEWKREARRNKSLSMKELVRRADRIEQKLEKHMSQHSSAAKIGGDGFPDSDPNAPGNKFKRLVYCFTEIFACSALIYVHVVVSGLNWGLPEIQQAVARSLPAFSTLPAPFWFRFLAWTFCITGCLAVNSQVDTHRSFVTAAGIDELSALGCWKAPGIM